MSAMLEPYPTGSFFGSLPLDLRNLLISFAKQSRHEDGEQIHQRGDRGQSLSIIQSGAVRFSNVGLDGRRVSTTTLGPGESFGEFTLFTDMPRLFDMHARGPTVLRIIKRDQFEKLLETESRLSGCVIGLLAQRLLLALEVLDDERRLPLAARLAKAILRRPRVNADDLVIAVTQKDLADELAVSRVALGSALKNLRGLNLLDTSYGHGRIVDMQKLEQWVADQSQLVSLTALAGARKR